MRLTVFSDYTLRVLIYLGVHNEELSTISEIAEAYDISRNHLMKVVHQLALTGHVETMRGKGGGMRLARAPDQINVGAVLRVTEGDTPIVECFERGEQGCRIQSACVLQGAFSEAVEAFYQVLDRYTLADLMRTESKLASLLSLPVLQQRSTTRPGAPR